jgi:hypothetical protein
MQVMTLVAMEGLQREAIAQRLRTKASTVGGQMASAYQRLGVHSAAQAVVVMFNAGWLDPMDTQIEDPVRYADHRATRSQRAYLRAFDEHLDAGEDDGRLRRAKRRTDAAALGLGHAPRSHASRDWMDRLIANMGRLA